MANNTNPNKCLGKGKKKYANSLGYAISLTINMH